MNKHSFLFSLILIFCLSLFFVSCDAKFKESEKEKLTSLHHAAYLGNLELVTKLIKEGSPINAQDKDGQTPLHIAVKRNHIEVVKYLIIRKADLNIHNNQGLTPLSEARIRGHKELEEMLRKRGAVEK